MGRKKITDGLRQKPNGVWELSQVIDGKRRWFSDKDPANVWKKRDDFLRNLDDNPPDTAPDTGPLFKEVAEAYDTMVCNEMPHGTAKSYRPAIQRAVAYFGEQRMSEIEPYMVTKFLASLPYKGKKTVSNQRTVLNGIYKYWINDPDWHGDKNPVSDAKMPRGMTHKSRTPPDEKYIAIVKENAQDPDALLPLLFLCTGGRRGEILALQAQDFDLEKNLIHISKSVEHEGNSPRVGPTKTEAGVRTVPLLSLLRPAVEPLIAQLPPHYYITSGEAKPLTASQYRANWTRFWKKHGCASCSEYHYQRIKNNKPINVQHKDWNADVIAHQFRHEYVCMLCLAGIPMELAILFVGHADENMIREVYLHLKPEMVSTAKKQLDAFIVSI